MSAPTVAPARVRQTTTEDLITRIRAVTDEIVALTANEITAARAGNLQAIRALQHRLACARDSRIALLKLLRQSGSAG